MRREPLIALAAVRQMAVHGRARLSDRLGTDRLQDRQVLLLDGVQVGEPLGRAAGDADGLARDDEAAEIFEEARELRIARRFRDAAVEREILVDGGFAALDRPADR